MKKFSGCNNIRSFQEALDCDYLPSLDSITYKGTFNSHYYKLMSQSFDLVDLEYDVGFLPELTRLDEESGNNEDIYLSLLIKSKLDGVGARKPINIVFVLDKSGSMGSYLGKVKQSLISLAKKAIENFLDILHPDDCFSLVALDSNAHEIFPLTSGKDIQENKQEIINKINQIQANGGTNLVNGYRKAYEILQNMDSNNEKRIIFSTDMNDLNDNTFNQLITKASFENIFTTILGIGVSVNSSFLEAVSQNYGFNYFTAVEENDLNDIIVDNFKYNYFPIANNLELTFASTNYKIVSCYGTDNENVMIENIQNENKAEGEGEISSWTTSNHKFNKINFKSNLEFMMLYFRRTTKKKVKMPIISKIAEFLHQNKYEVTKIKSMFSSELKTTDNNTYVKGGLILLKLKRETYSVDSSAYLELSYTSKDINDNTKIIKSYYLNLSKQNKLEDITNEMLKQALYLYSYTALMRYIISSKKKKNELLLIKDKVANILLKLSIEEEDLNKKRDEVDKLLNKLKD